MANNLLERRSVDQRFYARVTEERDFALSAFGGDGTCQDRPQRLSLDPLHPRLRMWREPREKIVHLVDRRLQSRDHVGPELGVVGVPLGVACDERELTD